MRVVMSGRVPLCVASLPVRVHPLSAVSEVDQSSLLHCVLHDASSYSQCWKMSCERRKAKLTAAIMSALQPSLSLSFRVSDCWEEQMNRKWVIAAISKNTRR